MKQYNITGMSCAACQARVEKAVLSVSGVDKCAVSLLTNSMGVEGDADSNEIIKAVENAGYGASLKGQEKSKSQMSKYEEDLIDKQTPIIRNRLIASLIFIIPLLYVSMGHMLWNFPLPTFLQENHIAMGLYELLLTAIIMVINQHFFISGFKGLFHKAPNMDTLVALGSAASFLYSVYALFAMTVAEKLGDSERVMALMDDFYFESAAMILTLITVGKLLESISKGRTTNALKALMRLAPKTAIILKDGIEKEVLIENVKLNDKFVLRPGSSVPVDGIVVEGNSAINEAALTGESIPVEKNIGDQVSAATINESGYLVCRATRIGDDTTLSKIIQMVSDAAATKAPIAKVADRVSGIFVPAVIIIAIITFIVWILVSNDFGFSLARAISVLVISCPCALGLATPVAIMVGNGIGAKNGIMFKTAISLEEMGKASIIALDKTGTITEGQPKVKTIYTAKNVKEKDLIKTAISLEDKSEHPLAKAIVEYCKEKAIQPGQITNFTISAGNGLSGLCEGKKIFGGNLQFITSNIEVEDEMIQYAEELAKKGETPLFFGNEEQFLGIISVADVIKNDSKLAIERMKKMGLELVMLTGDNQITADAIAKEAGLDKVIANVKPDGKETAILNLQKKGKVVMVGDGINDAPALTRADLGIAIGAGNDVAIEAADIVLVKNRLSDVAFAYSLSKQTLRNIHQNLFWAFIYNIIGIPLAAGAYIYAFGWTLNPMFGAAAMSLSSFCVVMNALRLNLFKVKEKDVIVERKVKNKVKNKVKSNIKSNIKTKEKQEEKFKMEIVVKGMMCAHCEAHVKEAIEKLDGVVEANADHEKDLVTIKTTSKPGEEDLKAAVEGAGYEFVEVKS